MNPDEDETSSSKDFLLEAREALERASRLIVAARSVLPTLDPTAHRICNSWCDDIGDVVKHMEFLEKNCDHLFGERPWQ